MRTAPFFKKAKSHVFLLLYTNPTRRYHMREIERCTGERINAVREALRAFTSDKTVVVEVVGKKHFFQANRTSLYYDELLRIAAKQSGLGARIISEKARLGKVKTAFVTELYYQREDSQEGGVDLFIVGTISLKEVSRIAHEEGEKIGREINYSVMDEEEYSYRLKNKDPFLMEIFKLQRLLLIGTL